MAKLGGGFRYFKLGRAFTHVSPHVVAITFSTARIAMHHRLCIPAFDCMPLDAESSASMEDAIQSSPNIRALRYGFEVVRVDARAIAAQVVDYQFIREGSEVEHVGNPMCSQGLAVCAELSVSAVVQRS